MSNQIVKKKNVYLDKINENLITLFRTIEKFDKIFQELNQLINGATVHINEIERILGNNENDDDEEDQQSMFDIDNEKELIAGEKFCELNENLNVSIREIRQTWLEKFLPPKKETILIFRNTLEKQGALLSKLIYQSPQLIRLFLDTTKNDLDLNNSSFRSEIAQLNEQFPIIGQFYYELYEENLN